MKKSVDLSNKIYHRILKQRRRFHRKHCPDMNINKVVNELNYHRQFFPLLKIDFLFYYHSIKILGNEKKCR